MVLGWLFRSGCGLRSHRGAATEVAGPRRRLLEACPAQGLRDTSLHPLVWASATRRKPQGSAYRGFLAGGAGPLVRAGFRRYRAGRAGSREAGLRGGTSRGGRGLGAGRGRRPRLRREGEEREGKGGEAREERERKERGGAAGRGDGVSHLIAARAARQARSLPSVGLRRASPLVSGSPVPGALPRQGPRGGVSRAVWAAGL